MLDTLFPLEPIESVMGHSWSFSGVGRRWTADVTEDIRYTPRSLFDVLDAEFGPFTVDVAALPDNALCPRFYTPETNGLAQDWTGERVWCNPPYSDIAPWTAKAAERRADVTVALLPVRTDLAWFHDDCLTAGAEIRFIRGRVRFGSEANPSPSTAAPFPCMVIVWH